MAYRLGILCLHLGMFAGLAFGYENFIVPLYGYEGYVFTPNTTNGIMALFAVVLLSLITPIEYRKPSTLFFQLTLVMILIPMMVLFYAEGKESTFPAQILIAYIVSVILPRFIPIKLPKLSYVSDKRLQIVLLATTVGYIAVVFMMGGGAYLNFDFSKIYDFRSDAANNLPGAFGYISPFVGKVVVPIGLTLSVINRRYIFAAIYLCSAILIFGLTANRGAAFDPFMVLFVYMVSRSKSLTGWFNLGILAVLVASLVDFWMVVKEGDESFGWIGSLMLARMLILPSEINYMYHEFFSKNDWVLFSDSKITLGLLEYKYPLSVPNMIGREYFHSDITSANTGWLGSGYAQAGFIGLLIYAVIVAIIYKYIDVCARTSGERSLVTAAIVIPIFTLVTSSDLPTTMLTHGLLLNLLLIACIRKREMPARIRSEPLARHRHIQNVKLAN